MLLIKTSFEQEDTMQTIIAGRFQQQSEVQHALAEMLRAGFDEDQISTFYVNPPGMHDRYPVGGDRDESPGAERSDEGRSAGMATGGVVGAAIGAVTTPVAGPFGAAAGALVGAHVGNLVGTLEGMADDGEKNESTRSPLRHAGMMVAVSVPEQSRETAAIEVLRSLGAADIEKAEGTIADGDWKDFDPVAPPTLVDAEPQQN
jgi:hypothetical protein